MKTVKEFLLGVVIAACILLFLQGVQVVYQRIFYPGDSLAMEQQLAKKEARPTAVTVGMQWYTVGVYKGIEWTTPSGLMVCTKLFDHEDVNCIRKDN